MKGTFATLVGAMGAFGMSTSAVMAHPGHSPADVTAQLASPLAGADHFAAFSVVAVLAVLAVTRIGLHLIANRKPARAGTRRR